MKQTSAHSYNVSGFGVTGLTEQQVLESRSSHGSNEIIVTKSNPFARIIGVFSDPMILMLLVAALLYFISGQFGDAIFMTLAIFLVSGISWYQESRSKKALTELKTLTAPMAHVIREGKPVEIKREEIVLGDCMVLSEGSPIPADGVILHSNDFSVNESLLTGESLPVSKDKLSLNNKVFQGTSVAGGLAICKVTGIGNSTALAKIGKSIESVEEQVTPLQQQIRRFVRKMALAGILVFALVWAINFIQSGSLLDSLLKALTLAMSILPEEIPVAFSTFMALGSWRLMKLGIIVKHLKTVETLGSATVLCSDKTGTITENRMTLAKIFSLALGRSSLVSDMQPEDHDVITTAMWASEPMPFDPMEVALHDAYAGVAAVDSRKRYHLVHEYPLGGNPPMMTHVFEDDTGSRIIAAKGAPEALLRVSQLSDNERSVVQRELTTLASEGFRVLGVASARHDGDRFPERQEDFQFHFEGLVAFYDPPKANIAEVFESFYNAGLKVKIITGDNTATTTTIAKQINFRGGADPLTGDELIKMTDEEISDRVMRTNIFTRMFPEAKLKILNALKAQGQVVAMTGDGVNDGPALKAAHIGIAMGRKGTEIAKEVSSLILTDDNLARLVDAIAMGRKIYSNLKKAIQYIISIHIPIILVVFIPLVLGWVYPALFSPVHVIFLELIMGPTCSIIYENEPAEKNIMFQKPRPVTESFFSWQELSTSMVQGLVITVAALTIYQYAIAIEYGASQTRTLVFLTLISANIFLTLVNRSFYYSLFETIRYRNVLLPLIIGATVLLTGLVLGIRPLRDLFEFSLIDGPSGSIAITAGCLSVVWYEGVKWIKREKLRIDAPLPA